MPWIYDSIHDDQGASPLIRRVQRIEGSPFLDFIHSLHGMFVLLASSLFVYVMVMFYLYLTSQWSIEQKREERTRNRFIQLNKTRSEKSGNALHIVHGVDRSQASRATSETSQSAAFKGNARNPASPP